jgi:hypothetical protein
MLEHFLVPQLDANSVIWQQDGASVSPLSQECDAVQNLTLLGRWIDGFVKDNVYLS